MYQLKQGSSLVTQMVKNLPQCRRLTFIPLEKEMATHSSIFALRIPWTEGAGGLQPMWTRLHTHAHTRQVSPSHGKGPDRPSACVAGLLQHWLQQEEGGVLQTVSKRCVARPHGSTCWGPVPPATCHKRVGLTSQRGQTTREHMLRPCPAGNLQ